MWKEMLVARFTCVTMKTLQSLLVVGSVLEDRVTSKKMKWIRRRKTNHRW